jgi:hypothetical protein|tara:strand:+ start:538 stop:1092 length:555 start_codon:yes stop_codon:yes gene_type:complete
MARTRDPFADKRKTSNGVSPTQAKKKREVKRTTCSRKKLKAEKDMDKAKKDLVSVEKKLDVKQQFLSAMNNAPTPAQQRKALLALFAEKGINPIEELMNFTTDDEVPLKERISIWKELASYTQPKLKSVDISATVTGEMKVVTMDFSKLTQAQLMKEADDDIVDIEDYNEFVSEEDKNHEEENT